RANRWGHRQTRTGIAVILATPVFHDGVQRHRWDCRLRSYGSFEECLQQRLDRNDIRSACHDCGCLFSHHCTDWTTRTRAAGWATRMGKPRGCLAEYLRLGLVYAVLHRTVRAVHRLVAPATIPGSASDDHDWVAGLNDCRTRVCMEREERA